MATPEPGRLNAYLKGDIGVLRRDYPLLYLWAAQRALLGRPLHANEIALSRSTQLELGADEDGFAFWRRVRAAFSEQAGLPAPPDIEVFGTLTSSDVDASFLNCQDDAFYTAGKRLQGLLAAPGAEREQTETVQPDAAWVAEWARGQDAVFSNCAIVGGTDPLPAAADAPAWLIADRAYQQAAALFYRGESARAAAVFAAIAADPQSRWHELAAYLVPRTWVREALYFTEPGPERERVLQLAAAATQAGLSEPRLRARHEALGRLQRRIALLRDPQAAFISAVQRLDTGNAGDDFLQDLEEVRFLRDDVPPAVAAQSWLLNVKDEGPEAYAVALARWRDSASPDWLLATLMHAPAQDAGTDAALAAAAAWLGKAPADASGGPAAASGGPAAAPGALALQYERARLLVARGEAEALPLLDALLARPNLAVSDRNALLRLRFATAPDLNSALGSATGQIIGIAYESERDIWPEWSRVPEPEADIPAGIKPKPDSTDAPGAVDGDADSQAWEAESWPLLATLRKQPALLPDVASLMDGAFPTAMLVTAAQAESLPATARQEVIGAGWLRAWLLRQRDVLATATPAFLRAFPQQNELLARGVDVLPLPNEKVTPAAFRSALAILRMPGLSPHVRGGVGRALPPDAVGLLALWRWWGVGSDEFSLDSVVQRPACVSAQQYDAAQSERRALAGVADATSVLGDVVLRYAATQPKSPELAEALYLLVRATRYGTPNSAMSKRAFGILHARYPNSPWTKLTPYFY